MANQLDPAVLQTPHGGRVGGEASPRAVDPPEPEFVALVTQEAPLLQHNAFRLVRNRADAADLTQDTIEKALRSWRRFTPGSRMRAWLITIMTNLFVDRCRRGGREIALGQDELEQPTPPPEEEEVAPIWSRLTDEQLRRALAGLEPAAREVYQLRAVHRLSYKSMALRLGIPVATVGTRLNRARLKLRSLLESQIAPLTKEQP